MVATISWPAAPHAQAWGNKASGKSAASERRMVNGVEVSPQPSRRPLSDCYTLLQPAHPRRPPRIASAGRPPPWRVIPPCFHSPTWADVLPWDAAALY